MYSIHGHCWLLFFRFHRAEASLLCSYCVPPIYMDKKHSVYNQFLNKILALLNGATVFADSWSQMQALH